MHYGSPSSSYFLILNVATPPRRPNFPPPLTPDDDAGPAELFSPNSTSVLSN